jgi:hypothetical protein
VHGNSGTERGPLFRDLNEGGDIRDDILLEPKEAYLGRAGDDVGRDAARPIQRRCDRRDL